MKLLAIDTATAACSVALLCGDDIVEDYVVAPQDHTKRVLPMVDRLLAEAEVGLGQLDAVAFTAGPGSFTGLRICLGVVQGLAYGADLPVVPVSSLRTLAASASRLLVLPERCTVIPAMDARMGELYWAVYPSQSPQALPEPVIADSLATPDDIARQLSGLLAQTEQPWAAVGNGWAVMPANNSFNDTLAVVEPEFYPHAYDVALLAASYVAKGETVPVFEAQPYYIRNEVSWKKRTKIRSDNNT